MQRITEGKGNKKNKWKGKETRRSKGVSARQLLVLPPRRTKGRRNTL